MCNRKKCSKKRQNFSNSPRQKKLLNSSKKQKFSSKIFSPNISTNKHNDHNNNKINI